jgi:hypothetical protein
MELFFSDPHTCNLIFDELQKIRELKSEQSKFFAYIFENWDSQGNSDYSYPSSSPNFEYNVNENLKIICFADGVKIEFYETKPHHYRYILSDQLDMVISILKTVSSINISKIDKCSWFSVLWTPLKSNKSQFSNTTFLTYYQFDMGDYANYYSSDCSVSVQSAHGLQNYYEIPILGILPMKFKEEVWLKKFRKCNHFFILFNVS